MPKQGKVSPNHEYCLQTVSNAVVTAVASEGGAGADTAASVILLLRDIPSTKTRLKEYIDQIIRCNTEVLEIDG